MKLFGKRELTLSIIGLTCGLILAGYILKIQFGETNFWIISLTVIIGLLTLIFVGRYANKE